MRGTIAKKLRRKSERLWRELLISGTLESPATPEIAFQQIRRLNRALKTDWKRSCAPKSLADTPHVTRLNLKLLIMSQA